MHHVLILDPGIASCQINGTVYIPLKDGLIHNIFLKNNTGQPLEGKVCTLHTFILTKFISNISKDPSNFKGLE